MDLPRQSVIYFEVLDFIEKMYLENFILYISFFLQDEIIFAIVNGRDVTFGIPNAVICLQIKESDLIQGIQDSIPITI